MKPIKSVMFLTMLFIFTLSLIAQTNASMPVPSDVAPAELSNVPFSQWQLNLTTLFVISQLLGRAYAGLKKGGGIRGIISGIWLGTNTPKS